MTVQSATSPFPCAPPATPALHAGTKQPIVLSITDAKIVNDRGDAVVLKGVTRPSLEWQADGQFLSPSDIKAMRAFGANIIRIPLNQCFWMESEPRGTIGSYKQIVDAMIYYAIEQKMAVILDLHRVTPAGGDKMADKDSIRFWQDIARTYGKFGTVLFELFNEPYNIDHNQWLSGGDGIAGYQQLYDAVRNAGANNLCIVGGLDWAYDLSFVNALFGVKGTGIVYCSHPYYKKGDGTGEPFASNFAGVLGQHPLIFTEFGGDHPEDYNPVSNRLEGPGCTGGEAKQYLLDYYSTVIALVNKKGLHYTGWAWWVDSCQPAFPCLIGDWNGTPVNGGVLVRDDLAASPGKGIG